MSATRAIHVANIDAPETPVGAIEMRRIAGDVYGIAFRCPCGGCERRGWLPLHPGEPGRWSWDGNEAAPTLHPSVHEVNVLTATGERRTHWHGWLRAGVWVSC